jgi:outer membrane autotransporter protein
VPGVQSALQKIAGEEVFAQGTTGTSIVNTQIRNISARLSALRAGATGISAQSLAMNFDSGVLPVGALFGPKGGGASGDEDDALLSDSRLGLFINGRINAGDQGATENEDGFDFDTLGVTFGADYRFRNNLVVGAAVGYADSEVEFNFDGGDLKTEALSYSIYGSYYSEKLYVDFLAGSGSSDFDTRRIMVFADARGGVDTVALGATSGDQSLLSVSAGYNFARGGWVFVPYFSYDYMNTEVDPYSETEGQGWELAFGKQEIKSRILTGGLRLAYNLRTGFGVFVPHLRAAFQKEFEDEVRTANVRFVNDPFDTVFEFLTEVPDTDFYRVGGGFSIVWPRGVSAFVDYESIQGYRNLTSGTLTAGLRVELRFK